MIKNDEKYFLYEINSMMIDNNTSRCSSRVPGKVMFRVWNGNWNIFIHIYVRLYKEFPTVSTVYFILINRYRYRLD